ncbi:MAG TPA: tautomerase family protein, partial [Candidatus Tripitaka californicus]|uniref:tautomerase family protein n=1 Tax=Candidatus Tripitaka californicus TaxID=3367616 RepID=UPI004026CF09
RSKEQKAQLSKAITQAIVEIAKAPAAETHIIFTEVPRENWASGGVLASDKG